MNVETGIERTSSNKMKKVFDKGFFTSIYREERMRWNERSHHLKQKSLTCSPNELG